MCKDKKSVEQGIKYVVRLDFYVNKNSMKESDNIYDVYIDFIKMEKLQEKPLEIQVEEIDCQSSDQSYKPFFEARNYIMQRKAAKTH